MIDRNQTQQHRGKEFERWVKLPDLAENAPVFEGTDVPVQYLFAYVDDRYSVYAFLRDFPQVTVSRLWRRFANV